MHKPLNQTSREATMFTFANFDEAAAQDAREYAESPSEREEREAAQAGQPLLTDAELVARDDEVAEDMAEWEREWEHGFASRPPWRY